MIDLIDLVRSLTIGYLILQSTIDQNNIVQCGDSITSIRIDCEHKIRDVYDSECLISCNNVFWWTYFADQEYYHRAHQSRQQKISSL